MSSSETEIVPLRENESAVEPESDLVHGLKRFLTKLCLAITIFILLLALGELASYIYLRLNEPALPYADLPASPEYLREIQASVQHQYLPFVQFRRKPYHGRFISVDEQGVRQTLNSHCDDAGNLQIWMFGDSVLWGSGVSDGDTIPSQLARIYSASGRNACIQNFAEQGWVSTQELVELLLQLKHSARSPDIVVFYDGTDEIVLSQPGAPKDIDQSYYRVRDILETAHEESKPGLRFLERSNTVRALNLVSEKIHKWFFPTPSLSPAEADGIAQTLVENYQKNLQVVDELARTYGFQAFYFWYPTSSMGNKPLTTQERDFMLQEIRKGRERFQLKQAVYELCSKIRRRKFFYLGNALDDKSAGFYLDAEHLTLGGNQIMAEKIFQVLPKTRTSASQ